MTATEYPEICIGSNIISEFKKRSFIKGSSAINAFSFSFWVPPYLFIYSVFPTNPQEVFPFENGIIQIQTSGLCATITMRLLSCPLGRLTSLNWVNIVSLVGNVEGVLRSSNRGITLPYPLESIINFASILLSFPCLSITVVIESDPLNLISVIFV